MTLQYPYYYNWSNNQKRAKLILRPCKVIARGKMNSRQIEFKDGTREIVSGNALRKIKHQTDHGLGVGSNAR